MDNISQAEYEWMKTRFNHYRDDYHNVWEEKNKALMKANFLLGWLAVSVVANVIFIGFTLFFYFKTH